MAHQIDLSGHCALVTGASKGLGQAMAVALAEAGANVIGIARSSMKNTETLIHALGRRFEGIELDLKSLKSEDIYTWLPRFADVDILVNNAGMIARHPAIEMPESSWQDVIDVNLSSVFYLSQAFAKLWINKGTPGKIIHIASMLSFQGGINVASYTASKSALRGLTMALSNEWAPYGINVNAIAPGYMKTDNTLVLQNDSTRYQSILSRIPAGRWGEPNDLKGAVLFLASSLSDYIHGVTLPVDGGYLSR